MNKSRLLLLAGVLIGIVVVGFGAIWLFVLTGTLPLMGKLSARQPWPVACTSRGCVTSRTWALQHQVGSRFAEVTKQRQPSFDESLTTAIRQHLVEHAWARSPVTLADARRYREEVLRIKDEAALQELINISLPDYDEYVILPFLQQEALRAQQQAETPNELYQQLSQDRIILVLPFGMWWDSNFGRVAAKITE